MASKKIVVLLLVPIFLFACALPQSPPSISAKETLRTQLAALPGAEIDLDGDFLVSYPGETLFAEGSAVPSPNGIRFLSPLADVITTYPDVRWTGTVRASGGDSPVPALALAEKRAELLGRYFSRRGVSEERLRLSATASDGPQLQLSAVLPNASITE